MECKYKTGENPVLCLEELVVERCEIVFFLGASGVGKSTVLETLGLMNNTIHANNSSKFSFLLDKKDENMLEIWNKRESYLADFRNKHLSFIFQSTNLFPTLNALENVLLTSLLQSKSEIESRNYLRPIFKDIFPIKYKEILSNKKISEMSGGQRQRLAFVRSIASDYDVLLADEPTGNLDWANANNLMSFLIKDIRKKKSTAIIVSHDINLAIQHADKIVFMDKKFNSENDYHYGVISNANTYTRDKKNNWCNLIKYEHANPPKISGEELTHYFKEKISKQNIPDV